MFIEVIGVPLNVNHCKSNKILPVETAMSCRYIHHDRFTASVNLQGKLKFFVMSFSRDMAVLLLCRTH